MQKTDNVLVLLKFCVVCSSSFIIVLQKLDINYVTSFECIKYQKTSKSTKLVQDGVCEGIRSFICIVISWFLAVSGMWKLLFTASWVPRGERTPQNEQ